MAMRFLKQGESGFDKQQAVRTACKTANGLKTVQEIGDSLKANEHFKEMTEDALHAYIRNFWREQLKAVEEAPADSKLHALKGILKPLKSGQGRRSSTAASADEQASFFE